MTCDSWTTLRSWQPPVEARYVRHFLANRLLPLSVAVDLLEGAPADAVELARSGVSALENDVKLLDLCTQPTVCDGSFSLQELQVRDAPDARVPRVMHFDRAIAALPVVFRFESLDPSGTATLLTPESPDFVPLAGTGTDVYPWAIESCGLSLPAVLSGAEAAGGQLEVSSSGALRLRLPLVS